VLATAWAAMLLTSNLAVILFTESGIGMPDWWPGIHVGALVLIFLATLTLEELGLLRGFILILLSIFILGYGGGWDWGFVPFVRESTAWANWIESVPWAVSELATHLLRLTPALFVLLLLVAIGLKRADYFLIKGDIRANIEPSRLLGMKEPEPWTRTGSIFAIVFTVVTFIFLLAVQGLPENLSLAFLPMLPVVLIVAAINAFNEEFTLRAAPLSVLWKGIGKQQALLVTTVYFGLGHFYGVPNGVLGVLLSAFLGWFLGKSLLETRGFFWAWLVHFLPDVAIFAFFAMAAL
jgi:membrane protease YdiL (CAAX protease family)